MLGVLQQDECTLLMSSSQDQNSSNDTGGPGRNPPLVIVSERGRHSEAARRIVRAQAARASAAQSRETRARNREDRHAREGRDGPQSPGGHAPVTSQRPQTQPQSQPRAASASLQNQHPCQAYQPETQFQSQNQSRNESQHQNQDTDSQEDEGTLKPLVNWIIDILQLSAASFAAGAAALGTSGRPQLGNANEVLSTAGGYIADSGLAMERVEVTGGLLSRRLPIALPKGFASLHSRIQISDGFLVLLSRTACFDYASPGVENRLHGLLFDIIMTSATATVTLPTSGANHPIQSHLRLACACLTIFQGQRADGATFAGNHKYNLGFQAAWEEALVLDQAALKEPKSAEAALWAIFIISVTCRQTVTFFHQLLYGLLSDLQLLRWEQVRNVLLDFIYPGSSLDEPCRQFYQNLQNGLIPAS